MRIYLILINLIAFATFWIDKRQARHQRRRIPEKQLHLLECLGGWIGIWLGISILRHKNRKATYYSVTALITILWLLGFFFLYQR